MPGAQSHHIEWCLTLLILTSDKKLSGLRGPGTTTELPLPSHPGLVKSLGEILEGLTGSWGLSRTVLLHLVKHGPQILPSLPIPGDPAVRLRCMEGEVMELWLLTGCPSVSGIPLVNWEGPAVPSVRW